MWLSEIAKRKAPDQQPPGDEDGPPSDEEEEKEEKGEADETDESDATSSDHENVDPFRVPVHAPTKDTEGAVYEGYFERQREARCGIHASWLASTTCDFLNTPYAMIDAFALCLCRHSTMPWGGLFAVMTTWTSLSPNFSRGVAGMVDSSFVPPTRSLLGGLVTKCLLKL